MLQFQSVLWPLLGAALDVGSVERETLVEEGMQLLSTVLSCARELPPAAGACPPLSQPALFLKEASVFRWGLCTWRR